MAWTKKHMKNSSSCCTCVTCVAEFLYRKGQEFTAFTFLSEMCCMTALHSVFAPATLTSGIKPASEERIQVPSDT